MEQIPKLNTTLNEPEHQEDEPSIKVSCNFSFSPKSVLPFLKTLVGIGTGIVIGASSSEHLPLPDHLPWRNSPTPAPQVQSWMQEGIR